MPQAVLVTGSSRGIGLATALALAREGFAVALNGPADDAELAAAVAQVAAIGRPVTTAVFDVTDTAAHAAHLTGIEAAIGPLTTLVNNAGVGVLSRGDLLDVTEASYDRCLAVNTRAMFFLSQAFARLLLARPRDPALFHAMSMSPRPMPVPSRSNGPNIVHPKPPPRWCRRPLQCAWAPRISRSMTCAQV